MDNYEKILAMWRTHKLEVAADIDRALDNFKTSFAFQSGRLTNPQITYHDTVSIFEKDSVAEYTGVVRSLLEQRNQRLCYEFTRAKLVERAPLDIPLVLEVHSGHFTTPGNAGRFKEYRDICAKFITVPVFGIDSQIRCRESPKRRISGGFHGAID